MNKNYRIKPGMVCSFDPDNILKQKDTEISHVLILEVYEKHLFKDTIWLVQNADDLYSEPFTCPERLLDLSNVCITRIPPTVPEFNDIDICCLERIIELLSDKNEQQPYLPDYITKQSYKDKKIEQRLKDINRLKAIYEKIKFCKEMRDI